MSFLVAVVLLASSPGPVPPAAVTVPAAVVSGLPGGQGQGSASGWATWYDARQGAAAAGPALRTGSWRGRWVRVCTAVACVRVRLSDFCACGPRHGTPTLIDLPTGDFRRLAPLSRGVVRVTVTAVSGPTIVPPATDTLEQP